MVVPALSNFYLAVLRMLIIAWSLAGVSAIALIVTLVVLARISREADTRHAELTSRNEELANADRITADAMAASERDGSWYRDLFHASSSMVLIFPVQEENVPGHITEANETACTVLEYSREELGELTLLDIEIIDEAYLQQGTKADSSRLANTSSLGRDSAMAGRALELAIRRIIREKQVRYEGGYVSKSGKRIPVEICARTEERDGQTFIVHTARDLTGEIATAEALLSTRQRYKDFITNSPIGVAIYDGQKNLLEVNSSGFKMFGCPDRTEFARFNIFDNPFLPAQVQREIRKGGSVRFEMALDFDRAVKDGLFISANQGKRHFDLLITNLGLDKDYNSRGYLVQIQDITRRHDTEAVLRQREKQLRQAQKLEAIGALAGGIAHDFNNILTPILGYAEMGLDLCPEGEKLHQFLEEVLASSRRAKDLVSQILTFSRQTDGSRHPIQLTPIIKEVIKQTASILPDEIKISRALKTDEDRVMANPTQIHQILMNLCTNAMNSMKNQGGEMEVRLSTFVLARHHRKEFPQLVTTDYLLNEERTRYLRISVRDTGHGMDAETMERIFEPFFTTRESGEGTGMGLSVVHGIVISMGGAISVESEVGKGTVFHVVLPTVAEPQEEVEQAIPLVQKGSSLHVLFVDDEVGIIKMAEHMLRSLGYEPVVTNTSKEALRLFEKQPSYFDVVITDQVMPEMTGSEMAEQMLARRPDLPIVLCTGFSESLTPAQARSIGIREVLMKPIEKRDLALSINRVISSSPDEPTQDGDIIDAGQSVENNSKASITL